MTVQNGTGLLLVKIQTSPEYILKFNPIPKELKWRKRGGKSNNIKSPFERIWSHTEKDPIHLPCVTSVNVRCSVTGLQWPPLKGVKSLSSDESLHIKEWHYA